MYHTIYSHRALWVFRHPFKGPWGYHPNTYRLYLVPSFGMSFARLLRRFSQPTLARSGPTDAGSGTSDDSNIPQRGRQASESIPTIRRPWKAKRPSSTDHASPSQLTPAPPLKSVVNSPTGESGVDEMPPPVPAIPTVLLTNVVVVPSPEIIPAIDHVSDKLADAWGAVKEDPKFANTSRKLDTAGVFSAPLFFFP